MRHWLLSYSISSPSMIDKCVYCKVVVIIVWETIQGDYSYVFS